MDYYDKHAKFGGVFSRDNLPYMLKEQFYIVNLDDKEGPGTHWVVIFNIGEQCIYFDSFAVDPPEEVISRMRQTNKKMIANIYRIQAIDSINCGFFCIYVVDQLLKGKNFISILTVFDPNNYKLNDKYIEKLF